MKKTLAFILSFLFVFSAFAVPAYADTDDEAYDFIVDAIARGEERIDISAFGLTTTELKTLVSYIWHNEPMLFYFNGGYRYSFYEENKPIELMPNYRMDATERATAVEYVNGVLDAVIASMPKGLDDYEKALYLHDFMCVSFEYDLGYEIANIYDMIIEGKGVCTGYALLYDELLSRVGIESRAVVSPSNSLNHMWNEVQIDGEWYYVDVTWDDPIPDGFGNAHHNNFLICETCLKKSHDGVYDTEFPCDECYRREKDWGRFRFPIVFADGKLYSEEYGVIKVFSLSDDKALDVVVGAEHGWYSTDGSYLGFCMGIGSFADMLFYNTETEIILYNPHTAEKQTFY
ncbi:MAG: hypothetical protein J6R45_00970, partial [Clostridia bacterium]|nr:hypothetical protein [Clostridia bacterium]